MRRINLSVACSSLRASRFSTQSCVARKAPQHRRSRPDTHVREFHSLSVAAVRGQPRPQPGTDHSSALFAFSAAKRSQALMSNDRSSRMGYFVIDVLTVLNVSAAPVMLCRLNNAHTEEAVMVSIHGTTSFIMLMDLVQSLGVTISDALDSRNVHGPRTADGSFQLMGWPCCSEQRKATISDHEEAVNA